MSDPRTVTLVTGDRVTLSGPAANPQVRVEMAPGRRHLGAITLRQGPGSDVVVIPHDVAPLVAAGHIDRALFDVTQLLAEGDGDRDRDDLPLLLTGVADTADLAVQRTVPALGVVAVRQRKGSATAVDRLTAALAAPRRSGTAPKLWLDHRRKRTLPDQTIDRAAVAGSYVARPRAAQTGAGVTIAVVDTGIDTTHPDLVGKVIAAQSFTDSDPGNGDPVGLGTFTASILAGSGAGNPAYRGIAPDAQLVDARACDSVYCSDSSLIAAMTWAVVEQHAPIVNVGGVDLATFFPPTAELDPIEATVEQLSAQYGALFVTLAGDFGESGAATIMSPGAAPSALTVGAINRGGRLAAFSARGPNTRHDAIKPDLAALGVAVVGAAPPGVPPVGVATDDGYQVISSTLAAVPYAAGAAALLLQAHPGWTGAELKAALTGAADPDATETADDWGAGRLDLARALTQPARVAPTGLEFGLASWPHDDDPVQTRTLTYTNLGAAPLALTVTTQLALANGDASNHMLQVSPQALTVAPGQTATVTVTMDTRGDYRDARYTGAITATGDGVRLITPVGVEREAEAYDVSLHVADRTGADSDATLILFPRHVGSAWSSIAVPATSTLRLPVGDYSLQVWPTDPTLYMAYPNLALHAATAIDFDGRNARAIAPTVAGVPLHLDVVHAMLWDTAYQFRSVVWVNDGPIYSAQFGPDTREVRSWALVAAHPEGGALAQPEVGDFPGVVDRYLLARQDSDHLLTGWSETIPAAKLATVDAHSVTAGSDALTYQQYHAVASAIGDDGTLLSCYAFDDYAAGVRHTEHYYGTNMRWWLENVVDTNDPFTFGLSWMSHQTDYAPGSHATQVYNRAPVGPAIVSDGPWPGAFRRGDSIQIMASRFSPRGVPGWVGTTNSIRLHQTFTRDGVVLDDETRPGDPYPLTIDVDPADAEYRLDADEERGSNPFTGDDWTDLSTRVIASWTFRSAHTADGVDAPLPLPTLRFVPELTDDNRAPGRVLILPAQIQRPEGSPVRRITKIAVDVSFDDGVTWRKVPGAGVGDTWLGVVIQATDSRYASLRASVDDIDGRHSELTIIHAYKL